MNAYIESGITSSSRFKINTQDGGKVEISYKSSYDFQRVFDESMYAQRRSFNSEEHECKICMRKLLGGKFFFLSGCEHYFCHECIKSMVIQAIDNG